MSQRVGVKGLSVVVWAAVMATASWAANASNTLPSWEGQRANSLSLNGPWEFSVGDGSERAESPDDADRLHWQAVTLPGPFMPWSQKAANETKFVWARRNFHVTEAQAAGPCGSLAAAL